MKRPRRQIQLSSESINKLIQNKELSKDKRRTTIVNQQNITQSNTSKKKPLKRLNQIMKQSVQYIQDKENQKITPSYKCKNIHTVIMYMNVTIKQGYYQRKRKINEIKTR